MLALTAASAMLAGGYGGYGRSMMSYPRVKELPKCLLPSCDNVTSHKKGYCCAEHFKESKANKLARK